jgi:hypothetical protein
MTDTHDEATAREALRDVARLAAARAFIARQRAAAEAEGREAWARLAGHTLDSIGHGAQAAGREVARMAVRGVDVHRIAREVAAERRGA